MIILSRLSCYFSVVKPQNFPTSCEPTTSTVDNIKFNVTVPGNYDTYSTSGNIDDDDSIGQLVGYCQEHDAVLAYYYTDDQNRTQICEIFDIANPSRTSRCHSNCGCPKHLEHRQLNPLSEENESNLFMESVGSPPIAEDSGLSLTEDNAGFNSVK